MCQKTCVRETWRAWSREIKLTTVNILHDICYQIVQTTSSSWPIPSVVMLSTTFFVTGLESYSDVLNAKMLQRSVHRDFETYPAMLKCIVA